MPAALNWQKDVWHSGFYAHGAEPGSFRFAALAAVGDVVHDEVPGIRRSLPPVEKGFLLFRLGRAGGPLLRLCRGRHHLPARAMVEEFCKGAGIAHCVASPGVLGCFRMRHTCRSERPYLRARMATNALSLCPFPVSSSRSIFRDELRLSSIACLRLGM